MHLFLGFKYEIFPNICPHGTMVSKVSVGEQHKSPLPNKLQDIAHQLCLRLYSFHRKGQQLLKYDLTHSFSYSITQSILLVTEFACLPSSFIFFFFYSLPKRNYSRNLPHSQRSYNNVYLRSQHAFSSARSLCTQTASDLIPSPLIPHLP